MLACGRTVGHKFRRICWYYGTKGMCTAKMGLETSPKIGGGRTVGPKFRRICWYYGITGTFTAKMGLETSPKIGGG